MTRSGFVIANLFRKRTRTILTLLSVIMAFLLFGLLQSVNTIFNAGADFVGATRLMVQARVSFTSPLPLSMVPKLEAIPGVARVAYQQWFGGVWQQNTPLIMFSLDPQRYRDVYPEWVMSDAQWQAFASTRTGMIVGKQLAGQLGWKIGQKIPIASNIWPQKNGSKAWTFDLVGISMAQSVRERIPELAVLKTLGFPDGSVLGFVLAEAFALCLCGGLLGLALASIGGAMIEKGTGGQFQLRLDVSVWLIGIAAIVLMSIAVGLLPALRARRLRIVDALAGR